MNDSPTRREKAARLRRVLKSLSSREREALERFYALEQDPQQISRDLGLPEDDFQKLKARVRKEFFGTPRQQ